MVCNFSITADYINIILVIVLFTTQVTAFRWPTKSLSHFQPSRSMIWAVGPPPFIAWADTRYWPSGDQDKRSTCVVPPHSSKGSVMVDWQLQSLVRHILTLRSSLCDAKNFPTCQFSVVFLEYLLNTFCRIVIEVQNWQTYRIPSNALYESCVTLQNRYHSR